ncbi:hypothetical protein [Hymenobacter sp.]|jgi:hypothetical protein|uniref:hypothetical protein n=1 Tax=Hymenobacter sp. TaxID=1898978 RepID=UPI002ED83463
MFRQLFRFLGELYTLIWSFLLTGLLGVALVLAWHLYQEEHFQSQLESQGKPVTVQIKQADRSQRALWDALGNAVYVRFTYQNRTYETRCVNDTVWLSEGDRVTLLYHPQSNRFGQLQQGPLTSNNRVASRLLRWTVVASFTRETKALGLVLLLAMALFFIGANILVRLTGLQFIHSIARSLFVVGLGACALFFTYDAFKYYQYIDQLKREGVKMEVTVVDTDWHAYGRSRQHRSYRNWGLRTYEATFVFNKQQRAIAIDEDDYNRIKAGAARLDVLYNAALNDFIAVTYSASLSQVITPLFFWLLLVLFARPALPRPAMPQLNR